MSNPKFTRLSFSRWLNYSRRLVIAAGAFTILPLEEMVILLGGQPSKCAFSKSGEGT